MSTHYIILTPKPQHFHEFFTQHFFDNFSRGISKLSTAMFRHPGFAGLLANAIVASGMFWSIKKMSPNAPDQLAIWASLATAGGTTMVLAALSEDSGGRTPTPAPAA